MKYDINNIFDVQIPFLVIGHIPSQLASLNNLQTLGLEQNNLQGPIPTWLGGMTSLVELALGRNQFGGEKINIFLQVYYKTGDVMKNRNAS